MLAFDWSKLQLCDEKNPGTQDNVKSKIDLECVVMIFVSYQMLILCAFLYFIIVYTLYSMFLKLNYSINYISATVLICEVSADFLETFA